MSQKFHFLIQCLKKEARRRSGAPFSMDKLQSLTSTRQGPFLLTPSGGKWHHWPSIRQKAISCWGVAHSVIVLSAPRSRTPIAPDLECVHSSGQSQLWFVHRRSCQGERRSHLACCRKR